MIAKQSDLRVDIVNLTALNKNYGTLIEGVINRNPVLGEFGPRMLTGGGYG